jgi:hypothetical protein
LFTTTQNTAKAAQARRNNTQITIATCNPAPPTKMAGTRAALVGAIIALALVCSVSAERQYRIVMG